MLTVDAESAGIQTGKGAIFHTTSDTETIAYIVTKERLSAPSIEDALSRAMDRLEGAYSLVLMSPQKLICARDPHGFRPLCYCQKQRCPLRGRMCFRWITPKAVPLSGRSKNNMALQTAA